MKGVSPKVTVAICACNEGANVIPLLESVLSQREQGFILEKILFISDGSTDNTVDLVKKIDSAKIVLKDYKKRLGKSYRLNEIYSGLKSDFVVQPDADVILTHPLVISELIKPMIDNKKIGMTGGNAIPLKEKTFTEKAIASSYNAYFDLRKNIRNGNNIWSATGRLIALRYASYKMIKVPRYTISNDHFAYFANLKHGFRYKFVPNAVVNFRLPQSLKDHLSQESRFALADNFMRKYFSKETVNREYHIPPVLKMTTFLKYFFRHPVLCGYIFFLNRVCKLIACYKKNKTNALWDIVYSTKKLVSKND